MWASLLATLSPVRSPAVVVPTAAPASPAAQVDEPPTTAASPPVVAYETVDARASQVDEPLTAAASPFVLADEAPSQAQTAVPAPAEARAAEAPPAEAGTAEAPAAEAEASEFVPTQQATAPSLALLLSVSPPGQAIPPGGCQWQLAASYSRERLRGAQGLIVRGQDGVRMTMKESYLGVTVSAYEDIAQQVSHVDRGGRAGSQVPDAVKEQWTPFPAIHCAGARLLATHSPEALSLGAVATTPHQTKHYVWTPSTGAPDSPAAEATSWPQGVVPPFPGTPPNAEKLLPRLEEGDFRGAPSQLLKWRSAVLGEAPPQGCRISVQVVTATAADSNKKGAAGLPGVQGPSLLARLQEAAGVAALWPGPPPGWPPAWAPLQAPAPAPASSSRARVSQASHGAAAGSYLLELVRGGSADMSKDPNGAVLLGLLQGGDNARGHGQPAKSAKLKSAKAARRPAASEAASELSWQAPSESGKKWEQQGQGQSQSRRQEGQHQHRAHIRKCAAAARRAVH